MNAVLGFIRRSHEALGAEPLACLEVALLRTWMQTGSRTNQHTYMQSCQHQSIIAGSLNKMIRHYSFAAVNNDLNKQMFDVPAIKVFTD